MKSIEKSENKRYITIEHGLTITERNSYPSQPLVGLAYKKI